MAESRKAAWHAQVLKRTDLTPDVRSYHEEALRAAKSGAQSAPAQPSAPAPKPPRAARRKTPATPPAGGQRAAQPPAPAPAQKQKAAPSAAAAYTAAHAHLHTGAAPSAPSRPKPQTQAQSAHTHEQMTALAKYHETEQRRFAAQGDARGAAVHGQKAATMRQALARHTGEDAESDSPQVAAARLKAARGQAERAEASVKHEGAKKAYEKSRGREAHLTMAHGPDSPQVHQQKLKTAAIAQEIPKHQAAMRKGSATHAEAMHELIAQRAEDHPGDELAEQRARGAAARAEAAKKSVETAQARKTRAQKRRGLAEQVHNPAVLGHQQDAERSRRHAADTQVAMKGLHEQVADHQHQIAQLTRMHGNRGGPVQQERAAMLTKQAQIKTLASEHERHIADATHSDAQAAALAGDRRAAGLHDRARVREASVGVREAQARTAQFKAEHATQPAEQHVTSQRDVLRERTERIKHASDAFHQILQTGGNELIKHMQHQVGH